MLTCNSAFCSKNFTGTNSNYVLNSCKIIALTGKVININNLGITCYRSFKTFKGLTFFLLFIIPEVHETHKRLKPTTPPLLYTKILILPTWALCLKHQNI